MRCRRFAIRMGIAALVLCSISGYLHSTTVRLLTTGEMVADSNLILIGKVIAKNSRWNNRYTFIVTDYRIAVEDVLRNTSDKVYPPHPTTVLTLWGGTVGTETHGIHGAPELKVEERCLLVLVA